MRHPAVTAMDKKYQAEDDVRTLIHAGEIKKDKARYKAAMAMAKTQMSDLEAVGGDMGKMSYPQYAKARAKKNNSSMGGYTDHYA